ncbi:methylated-DNA--protein-cysteine methyltransferase [Thermococcus thioreducens]|uniref:Methylated-DNA--protein-cysteine methyltransferase n=1 Tax=Thermococcus thioreducens TaxID=277988 RepID=A0A0Q2XPT7_9EURY|nr:methylated-DNA--protein-cysteine methyltransferase [Thermococcus thioreducens]ASJ13288.1 cysteine methyltransferase [Thermococcus thioreducens]KQH83300.1 cysteine methyltransferase [Thermococcus thioreducens]SEW22147.1 methylated-DNA-[protein]-cysteine S-methyltransferase [Thermococcus thioreducens]
MLSVDSFEIAGRRVWIGVFFSEKIQGITFSLEKGQFKSNINRLTGFLRRRGVSVDTARKQSEYPSLVMEVITGELDNGELLPMMSFEGLTPFERRVYEWLTKNVKRGSVITYGSLAEALKTSPRAIGGAMKRNPYPIVVPCHRVVARDGIGYYTPRLEEKVFLLEIEGVKGWTGSRRT